jgi:hypothetical protein
MQQGSHGIQQKKNTYIIEKRQKHVAKRAYLGAWKSAQSVFPAPFWDARLAPDYAWQPFRGRIKPLRLRLVWSGTKGGKYVYRVSILIYDAAYLALRLIGGADSHLLLLAEDHPFT